MLKSLPLDFGIGYADNNYIHHTGVFYKEGVAIKCYGVGHRVTHNLIHDIPRSMQGSKACRKTSSGPSGASSDSSSTRSSPTRCS